jgi:hypothetical protein
MIDSNSIQILIPIHHIYLKQLEFTICNSSSLLSKSIESSNNPQICSTNLSIQSTNIDSNDTLNLDSLCINDEITVLFKNYFDTRLKISYANDTTVLINLNKSLISVNPALKNNYLTTISNEKSSPTSPSPIIETKKEKLPSIFINTTTLSEAIGLEIGKSKQSCLHFIYSSNCLGDMNKIKYEGKI